MRKILLLIFLLPMVAGAQTLDIIGVSAFRAATTNLDGSGIRVAQIEGDVSTTTNFEADPNIMMVATNLLTYISGAGASTNFPNSVGNYSWHAKDVGNTFYSPFFLGVSTNLGHIDNYFEGYFEDVNDIPILTVTLISSNMNDAIANASYAWTGVTAGDQQVFDTAYDDYAAQYNTLFIGSAGNGGAVAPPATCYNGIGVGAFAWGRYGGNSSIGPTPDNGRCKPDITAPADFTSFSAPQVSGAAALLLQAALRGDGGGPTNYAADPRTLKALLLDGAVKPPNWTNSNASPLDARYGAGVLNMMNTYAQFAGGRHDYILTNTVSLNAAHPPTGVTGTVSVLAGWNFATNVSSATADAIHHYYFNVSNRVATVKFSATATLVWNRQYTRSSINNLDLFLYNCANSNLVLCSTSAVDNVEHIWTTNLAPGRYDLQVLKKGGVFVSAAEPYALAWEFVPPPVLALAGGASATLTWPLYPSGFQVEARTNLLSGSWTTNNLPLAFITNGLNAFQTGTTNAVRFFRLRKPDL